MNNVCKKTNKEVEPGSYWHTMYLAEKARAEDAEKELKRISDILAAKYGINTESL
jgi:hypothetical protein